MYISQSDKELVDILSSKVRCLSLQQIADTFFRGHCSNARRRIRALKQMRLFVEHSIVTRVLRGIDGPLFRYREGDLEPNADQLSRYLKTRWKRLRTSTTSIFTLHPHAARTTGCSLKGRLPHPLQAGHELALSSVYLLLRKTAPQLAENWRGEDAFLGANPRGQKPDAVITSPVGGVITAIELGGFYSAKRLRQFHRHCCKQKVNYEIW
ncbi:MAG: hypothetical protein AAGG44_08595 [Planctomycetota bacterium]